MTCTGDPERPWAVLEERMRYVDNLLRDVLLTLRLDPAWMGPGTYRASQQGASYGTRASRDLDDAESTCGGLGRRRG